MASVPADTCVGRLRAIVAELPEAKERPGGEDGRHIAFSVRGGRSGTTITATGAWP